MGMVHLGAMWDCGSHPTIEDLNAVQKAMSVGAKNPIEILEMLLIVEFELNRPELELMGEDEDWGRPDDMLYFAYASELELLKEMLMQHLVHRCVQGGYWGI